MVRKTGRNPFRRRAAFLSLLLATLGADTLRAQLPEGGNIVAGVGAITSNGLSTDINTASNRAVINWNNFSIGNGSSVNFNMPSADSAVLNRVITSGTPSIIQGALNSNGNVFLVNPSGVLVGANGVVNTNGFVASTLDISNSKFMAGQNLEFSGDSKSAIINQGTIQTGAGGAHLLANEIHNSGLITSNGGTINLATGGTIQLPNGNSYIQADVQTIASGISGAASMINNSGTIRVTGALKVGNDVYLVNPTGNIVNTGTIAAHLTQPNSTTTGGNVHIDAAGGTAKIGGTIDVSGDQGGFVAVTGNSVELDSARISAQGTTSGGEVFIGGGFHGRDSRIANAKTVDVSANSVIDVSNTGSGDAGNAVVWSDVETNFFGRIIASSAGAVGKGGFVEVSGKVLNYLGFTDLRSQAGEYGTLLLDPIEFIVDATNIAVVREQWGSGDLIIEATDSIQILAELFPTIGGVETYIGPAARLVLRAQGTGNDPNITIAAPIRETRYWNTGIPNEFIANGGQVTVTSDGSINLNGRLEITAGAIDLQGVIEGYTPLTINAFDTFTDTITRNVGLGSNSVGELILNDTTLGNIKTNLTVNGGNIHVNMTEAAGFQNNLDVYGDDLHIDSYWGDSLSLNGDSLVVQGPITGRGYSSFSYRGPNNQTIGLGDAAGDVVLTRNNLAGISGFEYFTIGNDNATTTALNADLGHFETVNLKGTVISLEGSTIGRNLSLETDSLVLVDALQKTSPDVGYLDITTLTNTTNVGLGDSATGDLLITRTGFDRLGTYENLRFYADHGNYDIDIALNKPSEFWDSVSFRTNSGLIHIDNLKLNTNLVALRSRDLSIADDNDPLTSTFTNYGGGDLSLQKSSSGAGMSLGTSTSGAWILDTQELTEITGFQQLTVSNDGNALLDIVDADLTRITGDNGRTVLASTSISISGQEGLKINGNLNLWARDLLAISGPLTTIATDLVAATVYIQNSLGLGDGTNGNIQLSQAALDSIIGFDTLIFSSDALHVDADFSSHVSTDSRYSATSLGTITQRVGEKDVYIYAELLEFVPGVINTDGNVYVVADDISMAGQLTVNQATIGTQNANGDVSVYTEDGDIRLDIQNSNDGTLSAYAENGSIDIDIAGSKNIRDVFMTDSDYNGTDLETLRIRTTGVGSLFFTGTTYASGFADIQATDSIFTVGNGSITADMDHYNTNPNYRLSLRAGGHILHVDDFQSVNASGLRLGGTQVVSAVNEVDQYVIWLDGSHSQATLYLDTIESQGNLIVDSNHIIVSKEIEAKADYNITLRTIGDMLFLKSVSTQGAGAINLIAGWDGVTSADSSPDLPLDISGFSPVPNANPLFSSSFPNTFGNGTGEITIGGALQDSNVFVGSYAGDTNVFAKKVTLTANDLPARRAQIGFGNLNSTYSDPSGDIHVYALDSVNLTGGLSDESFARIGHGNDPSGNGLHQTVSGDIRVRAGNEIRITDGQIGHQIGGHGEYTSGSTYIGVGNGENTTGNEKIYVDGYSHLTSASHANGGELRVYTSSRDNLSIGDHSLWNWVLGSTFNQSEPLPNQDYELPFLGDYIGTSSQNWTIYYNIVKLSVKALSGSSIYGDNPVDPGIEIIDGRLINGDTFASIGLRTNYQVTKTSNVGTYQISIDASNLSSRYRLVSSIVGTFTVNPAPLSIVAKDLLKAFRDSTLFTNADWSAFGLKNNETIGSVVLSSQGAHPDAQPNVYSIFATNAMPGTFDPNNYVIDYVVGNLIVTPNAGYYNYDTWYRARDLSRTVVSLFDSSPSNIQVDTSVNSGVTGSLTNE